MRGGGALEAVVAAALEEGVVQVGQVRDGALLLRRAQHAQVPLAQVLAARRLLPARVAVQDVVVALSKPSAPTGSALTCWLDHVSSAAQRRWLSAEAPASPQVSTADTAAICWLALITHTLSGLHQGLLMRRLAHSHQAPYSN